MYGKIKQFYEEHLKVQMNLKSLFFIDLINLTLSFVL